MDKYHKNLSKEKWFKLSFVEQMANLGSEIGRAISWKSKNDSYSRLAFFRALELLDLTRLDQKNRQKLKELCRLREILADYFFFDNEYRSIDQDWQKYFLAFNFSARINR